MSYDPSDLRLPHWLLRLLDWLVRLQIPFGRHWHFGMTRPGVMLVAVLFGLWSAAIYSGNNLLYLCGSMLTALAIASLWQSTRLLAEAPSVSRELPEFTVVGEPYVLRKSITASQRHSAMIEVEWQSGEMAPVAFQMRCEGSVLVSGMLKGSRRGLFIFQRQRLSTSAPHGLWRATLVRDDPAEWLVLPAPVAWNDTHAGGDGGSSPLEGEELRDLRSYIPGDAISRVHWRKAASDISRWSVKRFEQHDTVHEHELLRVDLRASDNIPAEQFEMLLGRTWHWIESRLQLGRRKFTVILGQQRFEAEQPQQRAALMRALAIAVPQSAAPAGSGGTLLSLVER